MAKSDAHQQFGADTKPNTAAGTSPLDTSTQLAQLEQEGVPVDCTDESESEATGSIADIHRPKPQSYQQVLGISSLPPVLGHIPSSSNNDRQQIEILRSIHPMRQDIKGASDDVCVDAEHSSVQGSYTGQPSNSPWIANDGNFSELKRPLKVDLLLPKTQISLDNNVLCLEKSDYIPVSIGWGFSLLGFFAGRFPGKEAIYNLTKRWKVQSRVSFHPKGWIVFRFEMEVQANDVLAGGPYSVFGIPLVLCNLPPEFRFDSTPDLQFNVWASLPNLPLELWNASAISKIASVVGIPIEVDFKTISKDYVAGPRVLISLDAKKEPPESITLQLHNGNSFVQPILLDYYPFFCTRCRRAGHLALACRVPDRTNVGTRAGPRTVSKPVSDPEGEWQVVENRKKRASRSKSRRPLNRSLSRAPTIAHSRSASRPPKQQWLPKNQPVGAAANNRNTGAIPKIIDNHHTVFCSGSPSLDDIHDGQGVIELTNKFQPFDDLEQVQEVSLVRHDPTAAAIKPLDPVAPKNQQLSAADPKHKNAEKGPAQQPVTAVLEEDTIQAMQPRSSAAAAQFKRSITESSDSLSTEYIRTSQGSSRRHKSVPAVSRSIFSEFIKDMDDDGDTHLRPKKDQPPPKDVQSNFSRTFHYKADHSPAGKGADLSSCQAGKKTIEKAVPPPELNKGSVKNKVNPPRAK